MTAARKSRSSGSWRAVYGGPLLLGVLSIAGLLTALLSEGAGRYFSWIARWCTCRHHRVVFRAT